MAWRFEPGEPLPQAFRRVTAEEIAAARAALLSADADREKTIHAARRSFKRLRALLKLAQPALGARYAAENRRWRDAGRQLAGARDASVLATSFDAAVAEYGKDIAQRAAARLRGRLATPPAGADADGEGRGLDAVIGVLDGAGPALAELGFPEAKKQLLAGLEASRKRLRRSWEKARREPAEANLHAWRKRLKDFSAQMRLLRAGLPAALRNAREDMDALAEILGREHDLCLLGARLASLTPERDRGARRLLLERIEKQRRKLCRSALRKGGEMSIRTPKQLAKAVKRTWSAPKVSA